MSSAEVSRQAKMISELRTFIKKVLSDPTIANNCMRIAREHKADENAAQVIAREISSQTNVRIPEEMSDADKLFVEIIFEVLDDEAALY